MGSIRRIRLIVYKVSRCRKDSRKDGVCDWGDSLCILLWPLRENYFGSYDFVEDRTQGGRRLRMLNVIDVLADLFIEHGTPGHIWSDNGPELVANAVRRRLGVMTLYIERGSPWENGYIESFNVRLRDELLNGEIFCSLGYRSGDGRTCYRHDTQCRAAAVERGSARDVQRRRSAGDAQGDRGRAGAGKARQHLGAARERQWWPVYLLLPPLGEGQILVGNVFLSVALYMRVFCRQAYFSPYSGERRETVFIFSVAGGVGAWLGRSRTSAWGDVRSVEAVMRCFDHIVSGSIGMLEWYNIGKSIIEV